MSASTRAAGYSAFAHIEAICALPEVLVIAFGVNDQSFAMGHGFATLDSAEVQAAHTAVLAAARRHGVAVMGSPKDHDTATAQRVVDEGASVRIYGPDLSVFQKMCAQMVAAHSAVVGFPYA